MTHDNLIGLVEDTIRNNSSYIRQMRYDEITTSLETSGIHISFSFDGLEKMVEMNEIISCMVNFRLVPVVYELESHMMTVEL